jgi:hypothetical protein
MGSNQPVITSDATDFTTKATAGTPVVYFLQSSITTATFQLG